MIHVQITELLRLQAQVSDMESTFCIIKTSLSDTQRGSLPCNNHFSKMRVVFLSKSNFSRCYHCLCTTNLAMFPLNTEAVSYLSRRRFILTPSYYRHICPNLQLSVGPIIQLIRNGQTVEAGCKRWRSSGSDIVHHWLEGEGAKFRHAPV